MKLKKLKVRNRQPKKMNENQLNKSLHIHKTILTCFSDFHITPPNIKTLKCYQHVAGCSHC